MDDFELAEKINKEINKRVTHWEEAVEILKQVSYDNAEGPCDEGYLGWEDRMYNACKLSNAFLRKVNEL